MVPKVIRLSSLIAESDFGLLKNASLCFGHFNVIHPGHIRYFQSAKQYGDRLVVGLEGNGQLPEVERIEVFPELDRAEALAALDIIDHVVILDTGHLQDLVRLITPKTLVLGRRFEEANRIKVSEGIALIKELGGEVIYEAGETRYATADLLYRTQNELEVERWEKFQAALRQQNIDLSGVVENLSRNRAPRILVLGDTIVDRYVACHPIGMSNEAPVVVVKELDTRDYVGGAGIVAAHVAALGGRCTFVSVIGRDRRAEMVSSELENFGVETKLVEDPSRPTTFKIRYLVEKQKLFRVSRLKEHNLSIDIEEKVIQSIVDLAPTLDGIIVCDFVYGVITSEIIKTLEKVSLEYNLPLFGDLQCSSQIGNVTKFKNFNLLCPTEREARIALGNHEDGIEYVANLLLDETKTANLIVKLGGEGFIAYGQKGNSGSLRRQYFPALTANPVDVAGAGDSLLAAVSIALTHGMNLMEASALGCCVSALTVQTVGNLPVHIDNVKQLVAKGSAILNEG
jgi:rfaE bifunctional protein kinase chain/domain